MSKFIFSLALGALVAAQPLTTFAAAHVTLSGTPETVTPGQKYTVVVSIDAGGESAYTARVALSYPTDTLAFSSFTLAPTWVALTLPGYDLVDTTSGALTKTAGFPGGFKDTMVFGTFVFTATHAGTASVEVMKDTEVLDNDSNNIFKAPYTKAAVTILGTAATTTAAPVATSTTDVVTPPVSETPTIHPLPVADTTNTGTAATTTSESTSTTDVLASTTKDTADSQTAVATKAPQLGMLATLSIVVLILAGIAFLFRDKLRTVFVKK